MKLRVHIFILSLLAVFPVYGQQIALTFDDAPMGDGAKLTGAQRGRMLIAKLAKMEVEEAAFFAVSRFEPGSEGEARLKAYVKAGHKIGNHSHSHRRPAQLGAEAYLADVRKADSVFRSWLGFFPYYRYPYLDEGKTIGMRDSLRAGIAEMGYANGYVTVDNYDWYINALYTKAIRAGKTVDMRKLRAFYVDHLFRSITFYDSLAQATLGRSPKHVLLLHENDLAAFFIDVLIIKLQDHGWEIISPSEAYSDPIANMIPDVLFNGQGRIAALARAKGVSRQDLVQPIEDETYLDKEASRRGIFHNP
ncbi:MAG: polysaccharide deacetylase family protein [Bacteroidota bacterium]